MNDSIDRSKSPGNENDTGPMPEAPDTARPASAATELHLEHGPLAGRHGGQRDPYAAFRFANYRLYTLGWVMSVIGRQVQDVAVGWDLAHRISGDPKRISLALGIVGAVQAIPVMLLSIPAGHLADRFDRRTILLSGLVLAAISSLGLAGVSSARWPVGWVYLLLGLNSTAFALAWPARSALLPQIVPQKVFANAMTWNSSSFQVASVAGPALGGLVVNFTIGGAYLIDASCVLLFAVFLLTLRLIPANRDGAPATPSHLAAGIKFVWSTKIILATITLDLFAVMLGGATALLPIFSQSVLHVGAVGYGWLKAAPAIGALVTGLAMAHLPPMKRAGRTMLWSVAGFGAATIVFGLSKWFWLSLLMFGLTGAFDNVSVVVRHTLVQLLTPDSMRGRVSAVNNIFIGASNQLGELESGMLGWLTSPVISVVAGGIGTVLVVVAVASIWPQILKFGSLHDARPAEPPGFPVVPKSAKPAG